MFDRPIVIGLSPNTSNDDYILAFKTLVLPWTWKNGSAVSQVEGWFRDYFRVDAAVSFNAGRSALLAILESLDLEKGSEVLTQAFTCVAVPNSILWARLKPVYVDIDKTLNIDIEDAEKKLTPKTKAMIVQHTFGVPADMDAVVSFCKKKSLILIEDCAHAIGATYRGKLVGTFGEASFFSFGRDKIVSSVFGGLAITKDKQLSDKVMEQRNNLTYPSYFWIFQQLLHPIFSSLILVLYNFFSLGKLFLFLAQKFKLLSFPVYKQEKSGKRPSYFPKKYPNALAKLLLHQLKNLERTNKHRQEVSKIYFEKLAKTEFHLPPKDSGSIYLRFNLLTERSDEFKYKAKQKGIILGNWYRNVIDPKDVDLTKVGYERSSCSKAEKAARESLNLPTYPTLTNSQINAICDLLTDSSYE